MSSNHRAAPYLCPGDSELSVTITHLTSPLLFHRGLERSSGVAHIPSQAAAGLLAFPSRPPRSRRVLSPTAGTRASAFRALGVAPSP